LGLLPVEQYGCETNSRFRVIVGGVDGIVIQRSMCGHHDEGIVWAQRAMSLEAPQ
jgi:hypothetical protein